MVVPPCPFAAFARACKGQSKGNKGHPHEGPTIQIDPETGEKVPNPFPLPHRSASSDNGRINNEDGIMTPEELQALTVYKDFPKTGEELIYRIGLAATAALIGRYPGQQYRVPAAGNHHHPYHLARVAELEALMGKPAAACLRAYFGGCNLYVPSCRHARAAQRSEAIIAEYEQLLRAGLSTNQAAMDLGLKYGVSGRSIEKLVNRPANYRRQNDE
jgi:hypothetical protein